MSVLFERSVDLLVQLIKNFATREIAFAFAYAILLSGLLVYLLCVLRPHWIFMRSVGAAARMVRRVTAGDATGEEKLGSLKPLGENRVLGAAWRAYVAGLRKNAKSPGGYVNVVDPHAWFALERLPGRGYEKWATTMAGVSLTVGLLFTFVGLTSALFRVGEAGADTNQLRLAIAEILLISSAKFITSMAGIVAYIAWTLVARAHASSQAKAVLKFATEVQLLTAFATPEAILLDQVEQSREQTDRLKTLADEIGMVLDRTVGARLDALPGALGSALQPALEATVRPVITAIEGMGSSIGSGNQAALEDLIGGLVSGVHERTGHEMGLLVDAMRGAADELKTAKSGIGATGAEFGELLARAAAGMEAASTRIADAMAQRVGEIDGRMQRFDESLMHGAETFRTMGSAMSEQMADGLARALENIAASAQAGAEVAREQAQGSLAPVLAELSALMGDMRASAEESRSALVAGGQGAAAELGAALAGVGQALQHASSQASGEVTHSFQQATASMVDSVETALGRYQRVTEALAARLKTVEEGFVSLEQMVRRNVGQLEAAGLRLDSAGSALGMASEQVQRASTPLTTALGTLQGATTDLRETFGSFAQVSSAVRETATAMASSSEATATAFRGYEQRFAGVDASLEKTVALMKDGVADLGTQVTEVVRHYDDHLARAVGQLRTGVEDISEAFDGIAEKLKELAE